MKPYTLCKYKDTGTYIARRGTQKATACGNKIFSLVILLILQNPFRLKMNQNGSREANQLFDRLVTLFCTKVKAALAAHVL